MEKGRVDEATSDNQYQAMRSVLNYYVNEEEFNNSFQGGSYFQNSGKYLPQVREIFDKHPYIRVNISNFFVNSGKNKVVSGTSEPWKYYLDTDLQKTCSAVGSNWYTKSELEERIKRAISGKF